MTGIALARESWIDTTSGSHVSSISMPYTSERTEWYSGNALIRADCWDFVANGKS